MVMASGDGGEEWTTVGGWETVAGEKEFYGDAVKYWEDIPATVDGMLGGFGRLSSTDVSTSKKFLLPFIQGTTAVVEPHRVLDCGAGIGRVSKHLLLPLFSEVDLVEQNPSFLDKAKVYLGENGKRVGKFIPQGLQEFIPDVGHYDIIWSQWVLSHLTNDDLIAFFKRCICGLTPGGLIIIKENIASSDGDVFDDDDSSVTRCMDSYKKVFSASGLEVIKEENQEKFPENFFRVTMFALKPIPQ